jgi:DNA repair protein RadC
VRLKPAKIMNNLFDYQFSEIKVQYSMKLKHSEMKKITSSRDVFQVALDIWPEPIDHRECFLMLLLSRANKVLGFHTVSIGGLAGTVADPKLIFQVALKGNACSIILLHNHPSGNLQPSDADLKLTRKLKSAGDFLDLPVIDHLIVSSEAYYSFADEGSLS